MMSKPEWIGLAVLGCGAVFGLVTGGPFGLALASVCLVVGFVLFVASEALGHRQKSSQQASHALGKTELLVLVKEVHARPHRGGKFQEIREPNQPGLEFEIFARCWLANDTDHRLGVPFVQVALAKSDGATEILQQIPGDMENWRLGRLRDEVDSWGVRYLQAAQERMPALNVSDSLEGGSVREGWLHCRVEGLTPAEVRNSPLLLSVTDSDCQTHVGTAKGPHQIPGRVWPYQTRNVQVSPSGLDDAPPSDTAATRAG